ncbi:hypothetical protein BC941DRAFT_423667 [Chlamydoabsidia padenii]|nr:hypothetical protein BC941DRAFT_423667 [Chlamydoabsidia padenii]
MTTALNPINTNTLTTPVDTNIDQQQPWMGSFPPMHESENHLDYVHSNVDMTVHTIDSIWPKSTLDTNNKVVDTRTFIKHILRHSRTRHSTLLIAIFYLFRIKPRLAKTVHAVPKEDRRYLLCGRRMFLVALTCAWKYQEDKSPGSKFWAKISGLPIVQITQAERLFLGLLDYQLHIPKASYDQWTVLVQRQCGKQPHMDDQSIVSPPSNSLPGVIHKKRRGNNDSVTTVLPVNTISPMPTPPAESTHMAYSPLKRKWSSD